MVRGPTRSACILYNLNHVDHEPLADTALILQYNPLFTVIGLITSLVVLPVGMDAAEIRQVCGPLSDVYAMGECQIGWSYLLSIISAIVACLLPVLSHYVDYPLCTSNGNKRLV